MARPKDESRLVAPAKAFKFTPGWVPIRVAMKQPDGSRVDAAGAKKLHADKPYGPILEYRGMARGFICLEYDPSKLATTKRTA